MAAEKAKHAGGRPPKAAADRRTPALGLRLTAAEAARVRAAAARAGMSIVDYVVARCAK